MKKTSFKITASVKYIEEEILKETGLSQAVFHRKAIDYFLNGEQLVNKEFLKTRAKKEEPDYIKKSITEQIYLDEEREQSILTCAEKNSTTETVCKKTTVLFQALYDYCFSYLYQNLSIEIVEKVLEKIADEKTADKILREIIKKRMG